MEWTSEERLQLISALVEKSFDRPLGQSHRQMMVQVMYLCYESLEFLEKHKWKFEDVLNILPTGQLECLATSEIPCGVLIAATITKEGRFTIAPTISKMTKDGYFVLYPPSPEEEIIIGVAARNIQPGDTANYIPGQNTADILTKTDGPAKYTWSFEPLEDQIAARARMDDAMEMKSISGVEREDELVFIKDGKAHPLGLKSAFEYEWEVNPGDESNV